MIGKRKRGKTVLGKVGSNPVIRPLAAEGRFQRLSLRYCNIPLRSMITNDLLPLNIPAAFCTIPGRTLTRVE
ncbi:hypothetical protein AC578_10775 [Pseudocercospora eumusae]|uniref:Uncharacterized protein n=1 Tax=Pseudocercospora eumusae TaxID=321146 RepID=A0A139GZU4_9PEZI|nr:hypothetical protein AC578_10775 [Pseudocercospora eumusae]